MPLNTKNNLSSSKIKKYIHDLTKMYDYTTTLSDIDTIKHKEHIKLLIDKLYTYNISSALNFDSNSQRLSKVSNQLETAGEKAFDQFTFCEIISFSKRPKDTLKPKETSQTFTFLKLQIPEILAMLQPAIDNSEMIIVFSDIKTIDYDVHETKNRMNDDVFTFDYLTFSAHYSFKNTALETELSKSQCNDILLLMQAFDTPAIITEVTNPGEFFDNFNDMPTIMDNLTKKFPNITTDTVVPFISYFQNIKQNINDQLTVID